jgi:hypothetical protein
MTIFIPRVDESLNVTLPGEILRAIVTKVVNINTCIVEIGQPMTRSHSFRLGDLVACRRTPGVLGETWQAIEDRPTAPDPAMLAKATVPVKPAEKPLLQVKPPQKQRQSGVKAKRA